MMPIDRTLCMGPKDGKLFADRCQDVPAFDTPAGPRCEACAAREMEAIREGACLLAIVADEQGRPRERLLAQYRRRNAAD